MTLRSFVIYLTAATFFLYGLAFSFAPAATSFLVTGSYPQGVPALVDFRATYGGMSVAIGATLYYLHAINLIRPALVVVIFVLGGMAITRTIGMIVDGAGNVLMTLYLVLEVTGSLLALLAIRNISKTE